MLTVTTRALDRLTRKLDRKQATDDMALRFRRTGGRWQLQVDNVRPNDTTVSHNGRKVLLLDVATAAAMTALTLLVRRTDAGPRLKLSRATSNEG